MKKLYLIVGVLGLSACNSEELIHSDYQKDINQALEVTDRAYEEERALTEEENELIDAFQDKYEIGKFITSDDKEYEMNVLEKQIARDIDYLDSFTEPETTLDSEEDSYTKVRNEVEKYLTAKEIPESLEGLEGAYRTYEIYSGVNPSIKEEATTLVENFDSLVNGEETDVDQSEMDELNLFLGKYEGVDFEEDGKLYKINDESFTVVYALSELKKDILNGGLSGLTAQIFNDAKKELGM